MAATPSASLPEFHPDHRPTREVFGWLLGGQRLRITLLVLLYCCFFGFQILVPYLVGRAVQDGIENGGGIARWALLLAGVIAVVTVSGYAAWAVLEMARLDGIVRTERAVLQQINRLGGEIGHRFSAGDIVSITSSDAASFGTLIATIGHVGGSLFSFFLAVALLAAQSVDLALAVLFGIPFMLLCLRPTFTSLETRNAAQRSKLATVNSLAGDTAIGLRVLRGLGGEDYFANRYQTACHNLQRAGEATARSRAVLEGAQVLLPGILLLAVVWWGARKAVAGQLAPGAVVAFYGYLTLLVRPLRFTILGISAVARARVAARRIHSLLAAQPSVRPAGTETFPQEVELRDPETGISISAGRFTALVDESPTRATAVLERLAGYAEPTGEVTGVPLSDVPIEQVRARIHMLHHDAHLFSGDLHDQLNVDGERSRDDIIRALHTAAALDIVGLDPADVELDPPRDQPYATHLALRERGRGLSGGQLQRLVLARALLAESDALLLDRPTSAVDARTERRIAARLARHRAGRTTVVATSSPHLLAVVDEVVFHGKQVWRGTHAEFRKHPAYRRSVRQ
ncbi:ABC transporter ATP-binding protein [Micromonospora sp. NPDC049559]|uniref:ABC transporter ATP-binding protein n=1 Tax=Micromonospora sp. NPDC049559 TaxID=3155923 RepID=UPI00343C3F13